MGGVLEFIGGLGLLGFIIVKFAPSGRKHPFHW
jgi:hypothetical protein